MTDFRFVADRRAEPVHVGVHFGRDLVDDTVVATVMRVPQAMVQREFDTVVLHDARDYRSKMAGELVALLGDPGADEPEPDELRWLEQRVWAVRQRPDGSGDDFVRDNTICATVAAWIGRRQVLVKTSDRPDFPGVRLVVAPVLDEHGKYGPFLGHVPPHLGLYPAIIYAWLVRRPGQPMLPFPQRMRVRAMHDVYAEHELAITAVDEFADLPAVAGVGG